MTISAFQSAVPAAAAAWESALTAKLDANFPRYDFDKWSVLHELLVRPAAHSFASREAALADLADGLDVAAAIASPVKGAATLERAAAAMGLPTSAGVKARGKVAVVVSSPSGVAIPSSLRFSGAEAVLIPSGSFISVPAASQEGLEASGITYRLASPMGQGKWGFLVDVETEGPFAGSIPNGTSLSGASSHGVTAAYTVGTIAGGSAADGPFELAAKVAAGPSNKNILCAAGLTGAVMAAVPGVSAVAVLGSTNPECRRGRGNLMGVASGGLVDVFVRTCSSLGSSVVSAKPFTEGGGFHEIVMGALDEPGFAAVTSLKLNPSGVEVGPGAFEVIYGPTGSGVLVEDARLSLRQTARIRVASSLAQGSTSADVRLLIQPNLAAADAAVKSLTASAPWADVSVRAIVPAIVSLQGSARAGTSGASKTDMERTAAAAIASLPLGTASVSAVDVGRALEAAYPGARLSMPLAISMEIHALDGTTIRLESSKGELFLPNSPERGATPRVCSFFCDAGSVHL